jgi:NADH/NAD ratio-sensing transcriptional regulator Rex
MSFNVVANSTTGFGVTLGGGAPTPYVISDNTGSTFSGTDDTNLLEGNSGTNFGSATTFLVKAWDTNDRTHTVIKFTGLSNVPAGTVSNGAIRLYLQTVANFNFGARPTINAYALSRAFVENQATWNIAATGTNWGTAGAINSSSDYNNTLLGSVFINAQGAYFEITGAAVDSYIQSIVDGDPDYGLLLVEQNYLAPANTFHEATFTSSEGTDGQRPELTFDLGGGGGGPTIVDLTVATFSFLAQAIQNKRVVKPTTASLSLVAQSIQNRLLAKLTSATLNFTAQAVEFVIGAGKTVVDLTVATLGFVAQEVRNVRRVVLTSAQLNTSAQTVQNRLRATVTTAGLSLNAQALTVRRVITTTTASLVFTAQSVQNKLTSKLTTAILNFQGLAVDMFNVVITTLVARARKSYSNYRRMLKQRRF